MSPVAAPTRSPDLLPAQGPPATRAPAAHVLGIGGDGRASQLPTSLPTTAQRGAVAVVVVAGDGEPHPELWPDASTPVLVVLPPSSPPASVVAAFRAGADACVSTDRSAEVTAHLGALRRNAVRVSQH